MSSFEASAAMAPEASGYRRSAPVVPGAQQRVIPVAELTAPAVGAIAPFTPPTLNLKAAQDLEQAMAAVQATGQAFSALGQYARFDRAMAERDDVYNAQAQASQAIAKMREEALAGKLNGVIDASDSVLSFQTTMASGWRGQTDAGNSVYQRAVGNDAADIFFQRRTETQKQDVTKFNNSVVAGFFLNDIPDTLRPTPDMAFEDAKARFPWMDRGTFMASTYGSGLTQAAKQGNADVFERIAKDITDPTERTILVDSLRPQLLEATARQQNLRDALLNDELQKDLLSGRPIVESVLHMQDRINELEPNDELRPGRMLAYFAERMKVTKSPQELEALVSAGREVLPEPFIDRLMTAAQSRAGDISKAFLVGMSKEPGANFAAAMADYGHLLSAEDRIAIQSSRRKAMDDYLENGFIDSFIKGTKTKDQLAAELKAGQAMFDAKLPEYQQPDNAITPSAYIRISGKLSELDAGQSKLAQASNYMNRSLAASDAKPGSPAATSAFQSLVQQDGTIQLSRFPALLSAWNQVPEAAWPHILKNLDHGTDEQRANAMQALVLIHRMDAATMANSSPATGDQSIDSAVAKTLDSLRPMSMAGDIVKDDRMIQAMLARYDNENQLNERPGLPQAYMRPIVERVNMAIASGSFRNAMLGTSSLANPASGVTSPDSVSAAVRSEIFKMYVAAGKPEAVAQAQSEDAADDVFQQLATSPEVISQDRMKVLMTKSAERYLNSVESVDLDGRIVGMFRSRGDMASWNSNKDRLETKLDQDLSDLKLTRSNVQTIMPFPDGFIAVLDNNKVIYLNPYMEFRLPE